MAIEELAGFEAHQIGGFDIDICPGNGKLNALVLSNRPAKNDSLPCIFRDFFDEPIAIANAFGCNQCPLGIEPVENVLEAVAFFADQVPFGISKLSIKSSFVS